ncbi:MAG: metal-binding protein ZinT [Lysinibacillus sp.]|nr:metal-binding protein ZinT [Lysinibacillus sp.]
MKKGLIQSVFALFLLGSVLVGCQEKAEPTAENASANSEATSSHNESVESHDHNHSHDEHNHDHDVEVKDRELSDWEGDWQSIYPYILDGTLDEFIQKKVEINQDKTFEEYKQYYEEGYATDFERIVIKDGAITFYKNGEEKTGKYEYHGYEEVTSASGKKSVRYLFDLVEEVEGVPKYIQFNDHNTSPTKAHHYHAYFGYESHEEIINNGSNFPTYFPSSLSGEEILKEMLAH